MIEEDRREVEEGLQQQGIGENISYKITLDSTPDSLASVEVEEEGSFTDVTSSAMPTGAPANVAAVVTLPELVGSTLSVGRIYRVTLNYVKDGNELESFIRVRAIR